MASSSNHEVMVILSDGKPVTVIKTRDDHKVNKAGGGGGGGGGGGRRSISLESPQKDVKDNLALTSFKQDKELARHKECDEHVELRRLRSENLLLQERIKHMEELVAAEQREKDDCIVQLRKEVREMAENEQSSRIKIEHLMSRIEELQNIQSHPPEPINVEVQVVQDELVASKLREAEAKSSFKELQQKLHNLEKQWQQFLQEAKPGKGSEPDSKVKNLVQGELKEQLMALRIREASLISELDEIKQKLMELETQNHIFERQTKRQGTENDKLLEMITSAELNEKELNNTIKNLERKHYDLESQQKEDRVMFKIREAEFCQTAAELRQRIAELEIENQELLTSTQLHNKDQDVKELENRILELQEEISHLKFRLSDGTTAEIRSLPNIMTESFISDNVCLQPTNFDSLVNFTDDRVGQMKELFDHD